MNNNSKLHKSSSIFLAAVLVAGVIAIASPSLAFAEERYEKKYKSYDEYEEKKHSDPTRNSAYCDNGNIVINAFRQIQVQKEIERNDHGSSLLNNQQLPPKQSLDKLLDIDSLLKLDRNVINICLNFDNSIEVALAGSQEQTGADAIATDAAASTQQ